MQTTVIIFHTIFLVHRISSKTQAIFRAKLSKDFFSVESDPRFPFEEKVNDNVTKVSILAQAQLGCLSIDDAKCPGLMREAARIVQVGQRLSRCLSELLWCAPDADKGWVH